MNVHSPDPRGTVYVLHSWQLEGWAWFCVFILIRQQESITRAQKAPETVSREKQRKEPSIFCWRKRRTGQ